MRTTSYVAIGALLATTLAAAPAEARSWHHRDGIDAGDIIIGAVVLGTIAAVATAAGRDRDYDDRYYGRGYGYGSGGSDDAVGACAYEAERQASRYGSRGRVQDIRDVDRRGAGYRVKGIVEIDRRGGWDRGWDRGYRYGDRLGFTCTARYGRVTAFRFTDDYGYRY